MWSVPSGSERRILRKSSSVACGIFASGPLVRTFTITVRILMTRCIWLSRPGNGSNRKSRPLGRLFFVFCTSTRQRGESRRIYHLPHGGGWRPPGRPGAALGSWVATRGGKSSRWYIFPMEAAGSLQASPELSWRAGWPPWKRRADGCAIFPMEEEGSHIRKGVR